MLTLGALHDRGYQVGTDGKAELKPLRPRTVGEGRRQIAEVFRRNRWDERSIGKYFEIHEVDAQEVMELSAEQVRKVLGDLERAHMILYRD